MRYVVTGDNHLRMDVASCRRETDEEWMIFQEKILKEIIDKANKLDAHIVCTGDLLDSPRVGDELISMFIFMVQHYLRNNWFMIGGNHSLIWHREDMSHKGSIGILQAVEGKIQYLRSNEEIIDGRFQHSAGLNDEITIVHTLTFPTEDEIPFGANATTAGHLTTLFDTKYVLCGDMHKSFVYHKDDRWVINPGCATIQTVNEFDYTPTVYFVDTEKEIVEPILLSNPIEMLTRDHLTARLEKDARIAEAIEVLRKDGDRVSLSFMTNLLSYLEGKELPKGMEDILDELKEVVRNGVK